MTFDQGATPPFAAGDLRDVARAPAWVPQVALLYLAHTEAGLPIRVLARDSGCHASTLLRQIRRLENRRDDLLVDQALQRLSQIHATHMPAVAAAGSRSKPLQKKEVSMTMQSATLSAAPDAPPSNELLKREGRRVLLRLAEQGAVLAVAAEMDKAVVVREDARGGTTRTAVVDSAVAQAMALKEWIVCEVPGRISRYRITGAGRAALAGLLAEAENGARQGMSEGQARFIGREAAQDDRSGAELSKTRRRMRYSAAETPLLALARRRDKSGAPFLSDDLVSAGERLREDFELAQMGPKVAQNWDGFLTGGVQSGAPSGGGLAQGPAAARARIAAALRDLGPGLSDVALRCCCYLEGLETAERRMGWSARSGKIVLRIALQRLRRHYDGLGQAGGMIG